MGEKIKLSLMRFFQGRYGNDELNRVIATFACILIVVNLFIQNTIVMVVVDVLFLYCLFRMLSKNIWSRQKENFVFLDRIKPIKTKVDLLAKNVVDKQHRYFLCPNCHQMVRVPKGRGKIEITCPKCNKKFVKHS